MEVTSLQMYLLIMLDNVGDVSVVMSIALGATLMWTIIGVVLDEFKLKFVIPVALVWLFFVFIATFIPTTKQACAIIIAPKIINNEQVQEIPNKILELGNEWLDELKPKGEE